MSDALNGGSDAATKHAESRMRRYIRVPSVPKDQIPFACLVARGGELEDDSNIKGDLSLSVIMEVPRAFRGVFS